MRGASATWVWIPFLCRAKTDIGGVQWFPRFPFSQLGKLVFCFYSFFSMHSPFSEPQASGNTKKVNRRATSRKRVGWCGVGGYPSSGFLVLWPFERKTPLLTCQLAKDGVFGAYHWYRDKHHHGKSTPEHRLLKPPEMVLLECSLPNLVLGTPSVFLP